MRTRRTGARSSPLTEIAGPVAESGSGRRARRLGVRILVGSLLVSLIAAELLLRYLAPISDPYARYKIQEAPKPLAHEHPQNFVFETEAERGLPGMPPGHRRFTTNNVRFRGDFLRRPKPASEYRIFMVGGSTTENFYLDDREAITAVLQAELNRKAGRKREYRVYGAAVSGDMSSDHIAVISQRIVHLEPDMIILFCGINDLSFAIYQRDYCFLPTKVVTRYSLRNLLAFAATEFQLPRYVYYFSKRILRKDVRAVLEDLTKRTNTRDKIDLIKNDPIARTRPRTDLPSYEENLKSIIGLAQAHGIRLVFVTQATSWHSRVDPRAADWHYRIARAGVRYPEEWMDEAMESYNDVMRRLGSQNRIPVFDLAHSIEKSLEFFYDDCHFNVAGARRAGLELAGFLSETVQGN